MSTIHLTSLRCLDAQEGGGDEIYLKFKDNGGTGSGKSIVQKGMDNGDSRPMDDIFNFSGSVKVSMYEEDTFSDDFIQAYNLSAPGSYNVTFTGDGAKYKLEFFIA